MEEPEESARQSEPVDIAADFKAYQDQVTSSLVNVVKTAGAIANQDLSFHRSVSDQVSRSLDRQNTHLLRLTNKLLAKAGADSTIKTPQLRNQDGINDKWRGIVDVIDDLLEKADASLDEFTGAIKRLSPSVPDRAQTPSKSQTLPNSRTYPSPHVSQTRSQDKPQSRFNRKVNNHDPAPFKPLLKYKPHSIVDLPTSIGDGQSGSVIETELEGRSDRCSYSHPYAEEIERYQYPPRVYQQLDPILYRPPEESEPIFVDTEEAMLQMLVELKRAEEIAVDLEHHDFRTYTGIVCLMQISTREKDWLVDTLVPWRENLQVLNEVFTDPKIIKVFHGSAMDMIWLQRDLGLYVVGLFDTYYACEALNFPARGLKYLLQRFVNFEADKKFQLADWRERPLPPHLVDYARSDTHYLLYIYDEVRNLLVENSTPNGNLIDHVLEGSKKEARQTYERFHYDAESGRGSGGWFGMYVDRSVNFTPAQFAVYRALHAWRDAKARELDDSTGFILSNRNLLALAEAMPKNMTSLYKDMRPDRDIFHPGHGPEVFKTVAKAIDGSKDDPPVHEQIRQNEEKYGARPQNRWRRSHASNAANNSQLTGVAATLQQLTKNGDLNQTASSPAAHDEKALEASYAARALQSNFWGMMSAAPFGFVDPSVALSAMQTMLPLPDVSSESFDLAQDATPTIVPAATQFETQTPATSTPTQATPPANGIFTLRDQSRKRKATQEPDPDQQEVDDPFSNQDLSSITDADASISYSKPGQGTAAINADRRSSKKQRKAEKKALKAAMAEEQERQAREMVPFDYAGADSMLTEPKAVVANGESGKGKGPRMNPFAKAMDTGTGARRNQLAKEGAGKSMTFQQ